MTVTPDLTHDQIIESAMRGDRLYGDDFGPAEIEAWFADEVKGYAELEHADSQTDAYHYFALDEVYAWGSLPKGPLKVMGLGSAWGSEFIPIAEHIDSLTIVEPSKVFWRDKVAGISVNYVMPEPSGRLPFEDNSFDVVCAFGVLHHIPNVTQVMGELSRVLKPGGRLFMREPVTSMGDWRRPRRGLTLRERGLPRNYLASVAPRLGMEIVKENIVGFAPLVNLATRKANATPWNSTAFVMLDRLLSRMSAWNWSYHRTSFLKKFAPSLGCWTLTKAQPVEPKLTNSMS